MARNQRNTPPPTDKTAWIRTIILLVAFIAAIPLVILSIIYATNLQRQVEGLKKDNDNLLSQVTDQKKLMEQQRQLTAQQLEINKSMLAVAQQQLDTARTTLSVVQASDAKLSQSLALQQQLLGVAQATLQQAQEINRKTPPSITVTIPGLPSPVPAPALPL
jgi:nitrogen fixation/metabolism regulation signal transduction histidine kinase